MSLWMWGAVAALLLFAIFTSWEAVQLKKRIAESTSQTDAVIAKRATLQEQLALAQREALIITDPRSVKISLHTDNTNFPELRAIWHAKLGIVISGKDVPAPSGTHTFQLWLIPKAPSGKPIPSFASRPDAQGKFVMLVSDPPNALEATKALAITEEPAGGSQTPTTKLIWIGAISESKLR